MGGFQWLELNICESPSKLMLYVVYREDPNLISSLLSTLYELSWIRRYGIGLSVILYYIFYTCIVFLHIESEQQTDLSTNLIFGKFLSKS